EDDRCPGSASVLNFVSSCLRVFVVTSSSSLGVLGVLGDSQPLRLGLTRGHRCGSVKRGCSEEEVMADPRVVKLAQVLVDFSAPVKRGDQVAIYGGTAAEPLLRELYAACLRKGAHPTLNVSLPELEEVYYRLAAAA